MHGTLSGKDSIRGQLEQVHASLRRELPEVRRVAVALHDRDTDLLQTLVHSTDGPVPFTFYEVRLAEVPSLAELAASRRDRVLDDLEVLRSSTSTHSRLLLEGGYRSSYTRPFYDHGRLGGFVFYDSTLPAYFTPTVVHHLTLHAHLVALLVLNALAPAKLLRSAVDVAREMSHLRDEETGAHLDRMARYARLIAREVAAREGHDDEFVEFVFLFAPLHDIGKIAIPDRVLLKPDRLTKSERTIMRSHVERGIDLVDAMARAFGLDGDQQLTVLRNIVACHHECFDGSGYPRGLRGRDIPLEARIVAVADVFDALTTARPYKRAWGSEEALVHLDEQAGQRFDADCVHALVTQRREVEAIRERFGSDEHLLAALHDRWDESA